MALPLSKYKFVYLIKNTETQQHKIGIATNVENRLKQLQTGSPARLEVIHVIKTLTPFELEQELHCKYKDKRLLGEWFNLSDFEVEEIKNKDTVNQVFITNKKKPIAAWGEWHEHYKKTKS